MQEMLFLYVKSGWMVRSLNTVCGSGPEVCGHMAVFAEYTGLDGAVLEHCGGGPEVCGHMAVLCWEEIKPGSNGHAWDIKRL